jgi:hypothetical protein
MRIDQFERLQKLSEDLTDLILIEADPARWPQAGVALSHLTNTHKRSRYLAKKNANATLALLTRLDTLTHTIQRRSSTDPVDDSGDLDREIQAAEKQANETLARATKMIGDMDRFDAHLKRGKRD